MDPKINTESFSDETKKNFSPISREAMQNLSDGVPEHMISRQTIESNSYKTIAHGSLTVASLALCFHYYIQMRMPVGEVARMTYESSLPKSKLYFRKGAPFVFGVAAIVLSRSLINSVRSE